MSRCVFSLMALSQVAATSLVDGSASSQRSCKNPASCLAQESVLLQTQMRESTLSGSAKVAELVAESSCDACADAFVASGGCEIYQDSKKGKKGKKGKGTGNRMDEDEEKELFDAISRVAEAASCNLDLCGEEMLSRCSPEQDVEEPVCDRCAASFSEAGGCEAMHKKDFGAIFGIVTFGELSCVFGECKDQVDTFCFPQLASDEDFCGKCAVDFEAAGGCESMRKTASPGNFSRFVPDGCWPCGDAATGHCAKGPTCAGCLDAFKGNAKLCDDVFSDTSVPTPFPAQCQNVGLECMENAAEICEPSSAKSRGASCHTSRKGEACFRHVRWAMEIGIHKRPDLYSDLSESSSFEDFQMSLHSDDLHGCPRPCKPLPGSMCHTAVPGEECHRHATWAKSFGKKTMPDRYPPTLTADSSFEDFQAWLSKIHHGDCLAPCEEVEEDDDDE